MERKAEEGSRKQQKLEDTIRWVFMYVCTYISANNRRCTYICMYVHVRVCILLESLTTGQLHNEILTYLHMSQQPIAAFVWADHLITHTDVRTNVRLCIMNDKE